MNVIFRGVAELELEDAYDRYAMADSALAERFLAEVDRALDRAARQPEAYQVIEADIRHVRLSFFPHALYFRVIASELIVLAVFHPARNPEAWRGRR